MVSVGLLGLRYIDLYKCAVKTYNLLHCIWQTHATVDHCGVSVFSSYVCIALVSQVDFCADIK